MPQDVFKPLHPLESPDLRHDPADLDPFSLPVPERRPFHVPSSKKEKQHPPATPPGRKNHLAEKEETPAHSDSPPGAPGKDSSARIRISEPDDMPTEPGSRDPFADPESLRADILKEVRGVKKEIKPEKPVKPLKRGTSAPIASDVAPGGIPRVEPEPGKKPPRDMEDFKEEPDREVATGFEGKLPREPAPESEEEAEPPVQAPVDQALRETDVLDSGVTTELSEESVPVPGAEDGAIREEEIPTEVAAIREIKEKQRSRSRFAWFWIVLILLAVLLVTTWYVGWLPKAFTYVDSLFETQKTEIPPTAETTKDATTGKETPVESLYEYYLQVSSWRDMKNAEKQKATFASQGLPAVVESHFIESKRATYYRVRLGPLQSRRQALELKAKLGAAIPSEAFVDSVLKPGHAPPLPRPAQSTSTGVRAPAEAGTYIPKYISEPTRGWAISVGAYSDPRTADREAEKLQQKGGLPAFISVTRRDGEEWYRVQVGPFGKEEDAKRYLQLVRVTYNVDAYIRRLR